MRRRKLQAILSALFRISDWLADLDGVSEERDSVGELIHAIETLLEEER